MWRTPGWLGWVLLIYLGGVCADDWHGSWPDAGVFSTDGQDVPGSLPYAQGYRAAPGRQDGAAHLLAPRFDVPELEAGEWRFRDDPELETPHQGEHDDAYRFRPLNARERERLGRESGWRPLQSGPGEQGVRPQQLPPRASDTQESDAPPWREHW